MDDRTFDNAIRVLAGSITRRRAIAALTGALLGREVLAIDPAGAAPRHRRRPGAEGPCGDGSRKENICARDSECCTGICNTATGKANRDRKGRCRCVRKGGACAEDKNCCAGRACVAGVCGGSTCDATTCAPGCCSDGACVPYANQSASQCGTGGAACAPCTGQDTCISGVCTTPNCDATTCAAGCCNETTCVPYASQNDGMCGTGGYACISCTALTGVCGSSGACNF